MRLFFLSEEAAAPAPEPEDPVEMPPENAEPVPMSNDIAEGRPSERHKC
jgi:hypothetical protein